MSSDLPIFQARMIHAVFIQLKQLGNSLKPVDEKRAGFFRSSLN